MTAKKTKGRKADKPVLVDGDTHAKLKLKAAKAGKTMGDLIKEWVNKKSA